MDRELYLPTSWTEDRDRCAAAGVPAGVGFATKPQLGIGMLARAHAAGVLPGCAAADEAFGQNRAFRAWLAAHQVPFVLATRSDDTLTGPDRRRHQAKNLLAAAGDRVWERRSAGPGAHGERLYDWTVLALAATAKTDGLPPGWGTGYWSATSRDGLIPLSSNEIRRLLAGLVLVPAACVTTAINWSNWRRRRPHQARACHYRRHGHRPPQPQLSLQFQGEPMPLSSAASDAAAARLAAVDAALPGLVTAFWLTGSATSGDWWPGVSDVDVVAGLGRPLTRDEVPALATAAAGSPVDGSYLPVAAMTDLPSAGEPVPLVVNGEFSAGPCDEATPVTWLELRQSGMPLRGPARAELKPQPDQAAVREWLLGNLRGYWSDEADEREKFLTARPAEQPARAEGVCWLVLGAPRLHATLATGEVISKTAAGQYAARHWPTHAELARQCVAARPAPTSHSRPWRRWRRWHWCERWSRTPSAAESGVIRAPSRLPGARGGGHLGEQQHQPGQDADLQ